MCAAIREVISEQQPDVVVLEDVMLIKSPQTAKILARLQGVIIGCCQAADIPYCVLLPSTWRKTLGFKQGRVSRTELKEQAIRLVETVYNLQVGTDEADAICIAMAYAKNLEVI